MSHCNFKKNLALFLYNFLQCYINTVKNYRGIKRDLKKKIAVGH